MPKGMLATWVAVDAWTQKQECDGGQNCGDLCGQEYYHVLQMTLAPFLLYR